MISNISDTSPGLNDAIQQDSFVDWGAIFAGVFVSLAISSVFIAFGSALGFSATSFQGNGSVPVLGLVIAAALWLLWVQVSSFLGGAYITGRMRRRIGDAKPHEVEMRDGIHGLIMWGVNVVIGIVLAGWLTSAGVSVALNAASNPTAMDYAVDRLIRTETAIPAANPTALSADEISRISRTLARSVASKTVDETDKSYLVSVITSRTGLSEADARSRLDSTLQSLKAQADTTRRYGILFGFLAAASLLVSAVAAWWAASTGGKHRDEGVDHSYLSSWN